MAINLWKCIETTYNLIISSIGQTEDKYRIITNWRLRGQIRNDLLITIISNDSQKVRTGVDWRQTRLDGLFIKNWKLGYSCEVIRKCKAAVNLFSNFQTNHLVPSVHEGALSQVFNHRGITWLDKWGTVVQLDWFSFSFQGSVNLTDSVLYLLYLTSVPLICMYLNIISSIPFYDLY